MITAGAFPTARDLMTTDVYTLQAEEPVFEAAGRLLRQGHSGAPVLDGRRLVGIITGRDLVRAFACVADNRAPEAAVRDYMTPDPIHAGPDEGLFELCQRFIDTPLRKVPVVDGGELIGVIAISDVLRALHRHALQVRREA